MYYPKSKIITDQFTNGKELAYLDTGEPYTGPYYLLATGKAYSGRNPQDGLPRKLKFVTEPDITTSPPIGFDIDSNTQYDYIRSKGNIPPPKTGLIEPEYSIPQGGSPSFIRYFLKRTNNIVFIEVSQKDFTAIKSKREGYNWGIYIPFEIPWTTVGANVEATNRRVTLLAEQRYKVYGLTQYITNYTEF